MNLLQQIKDDAFERGADRVLQCHEDWLIFNARQILEDLGKLYEELMREVSPDVLQYISDLMASSDR